MFAYQLTGVPSEKIPYEQTDRTADVFLKDGRRIRYDLNIGDGYMSQNSKMIAVIPSLTDKVMITDSKNQLRTVYQSAALAER